MAHGTPRGIDAPQLYNTLPRSHWERLPFHGAHAAARMPQPSGSKTYSPLPSTLCRPPIMTGSLSVRCVVQPVRGAPVYIDVGPRLARQVLWVLPPARRYCLHEITHQRAKWMAWDGSAPLAPSCAPRSVWRNKLRPAIAGKMVTMIENLWGWKMGELEVALQGLRTGCAKRRACWTGWG